MPDALSVWVVGSRQVICPDVCGERRECLVLELKTGAWGCSRNWWGQRRLISEKRRIWVDRLFPNRCYREVHSHWEFHRCECYTLMISVTLLSLERNGLFNLRVVISIIAPPSISHLICIEIDLFLGRQGRNKLHNFRLQMHSSSIFISLNLAVSNLHECMLF